MSSQKQFIEKLNTLQTLSGLDFGDKTIGIAISDKTHTIATPVKTINRKGIKKDILKLIELFEEYNVGGVVLGLPLSLNGEENERTKEERAYEGPGMITFDYGQRLPFSISRQYRMPSQGGLIIFPSWLQHHVHSFESDVERISVSGNIDFKYD